MRRLFCLVLGVTLVSGAGCRTGDGDEAATADQRAAGIYSIVIREIAKTKPRRAGQPQQTLYVEGAGGYEIPLEVQVQVVDRLKDLGRVRFIDQRGEAVQLAVTREPVRKNGMLILLNPVVGEGETVEVVADRYDQTDEVLRSRYTVEEHDGDWRTVGEPVTTPTSLNPVRQRNGS
jgi:hypothetical protein